MSAAARLRVVLYEGAGSRPLDPEVRIAALTRLLTAGYAISTVRGLEAAPPAHSDGPLAVLGRFSGALAMPIRQRATALFAVAAIDTSDRGHGSATVHTALWTQ